MSSDWPDAILRNFGEKRPRLHPTVWVAPGGAVVGDVEIGEDSSVFYGAVLRGDVAEIRVGRRTNLQDQCMVHVSGGWTTPSGEGRDRFPAILGDEVTVGHRAVVHGCRIEAGALIGIGAVVLDGAVIGEEALVGAGAVVTPGTQVEPRTLMVGTPARPVRALTAEEVRLQRTRALEYVATAQQHARASSCTPRKSNA